MRSSRIPLLATVIVCFAPQGVAAQALKTQLSKLSESSVAEINYSTLQAVLDSNASSTVLAAIILISVALFILGYVKPAVAGGVIGVSGYLLRSVSHLLDSFLQVALLFLIPLFVLVIALRIIHSYRKSQSEDDEGKDKFRERRPRNLKVRGVSAARDDYEDDQPAPAVKLNRPFG